METEVDEIFLNVKRENTQGAKDTCNLDYPGCKPLDEDPSADLCSSSRFRDVESNLANCELIPTANKNSTIRHRLSPEFGRFGAVSSLQCGAFGLVRHAQKRKRMGDNGMINSEMSVREVALQIPASTRVFEKLKIDYCCGGNRPLTEACVSAGVDVEKVIEMLAVVGQANTSENDTVEFQNLSLSELVTHIVDTHHVFTKSEMDRLEALTAKVIGAHGANHPELLRVGELFQRLCADMKPHMFKEEQILFPYMVAMEQAMAQKQPPPFAPFGTVNNPVRMMMMEHDTAGDILRELRGLTSDYKVPSDGCISYQTLYQALDAFEKDLHQHIHLENNILFPKAVELEGS